MNLDENWLVYDYETLSQNTQTCPIVCYAGVLVSTQRFVDEPYTLSEIREKATYAKFNIQEQVDDGAIICLDTLNRFWGEVVDKETRQRLLKPSADDVSYKTIPDIILSTVGHAPLDYVLTRGNTFDPVITKRVCDSLGISEPYHWGNIRDTRSFLDGILWGTGVDQKFIPETDVEFNLHDPVDDIALDILRLQTAIRCVNA